MMDDSHQKNRGQLIIYQTKRNEVELKVRLENETI